MPVMIVSLEDIAIFKNRNWQAIESIFLLILFYILGWTIFTILLHKMHPLLIFYNLGYKISILVTYQLLVELEVL